MDVQVIKADEPQFQGTKRYHVQKQYKDGGWGTFSVTNDIDYAQSRAESMSKYCSVRIKDYGDRS